jgi:hypothetical protein
MASGCIPVSRNHAFTAIARAERLDFLVPSPGPAGVVECLREVLALSAGEKDALRRRMREIVVERHSLSGLMDEITRHLEEISARE